MKKMRRKLAGVLGLNGLSWKNYIQDGLVLCLDGIDKGGSDGVWTSLVDGYEFTTDNTAMLAESGKVVFDGSSYLINNSFQCPSYSSATLEIVLKRDNISSVVFCPISGSSKIAAGFFNSRLFTKIYSNGYSYSQVSSAKTSISIKSDACFYNGAAQSHVSSMDYIVTNGTVNYIGCRYNSGISSVFLGEVYCIRIYSRQLSTDEIIQNYEVDKKRFGL